MHVLQSLVRIIPKLKTPIQLSGLALLVAAVIVVQSISPGNIQAILAAGMIGVSFIIFGQVLQFMDVFPRNQRALLFLGLFIAFDITIVALIALTVSLIRKPTADVTLYDGELPPSLDANWSSSISDSKKNGHLAIYSSTRQGDVLLVNYELPTISRQEAGGPAFPEYTEDFVFSVPVFSIKINNPTSSPVYLTEMKLIGEKIEKRDIPWIIIGEPQEDLEKGRVGFGISNFGWAKISDVTLEYNIVGYPADGPSGHVCCVPSLDYLASLPNVDWNRPFLYQTNLIESPDFKNTEIQEFGGRLDPAAFAGFADARIATLFGVLHYKVGRNSKTLRIAARIFLSPRGGPGREKPSYAYTVDIDPELKVQNRTIPISQSVASQSQDHFLLGIYTKKPVEMTFSLTIRLSSGEWLPVGKVNLNTFYPSFYGPGGEPKAVAGGLFKQR